MSIHENHAGESLPGQRFRYLKLAFPADDLFEIPIEEVGRRFDAVAAVGV